MMLHYPPDAFNSDDPYIRLAQAFILVDMLIAIGFSDDDAIDLGFGEPSE
jgi:hypothetical protein